jgi:hypothetical protein
MAWLLGVVPREQVGCPQAVAMGRQTARRAAIDAPLGVGAVQASGAVWQRARTGLTRLRLVDQGDGDARRLGFVREILALATM